MVGREIPLPWRRDSTRHSIEGLNKGDRIEPSNGSNGNTPTF